MVRESQGIRVRGQGKFLSGVIKTMLVFRTLAPYNIEILISLIIVSNVNWSTVSHIFSGFNQKDHVARGFSKLMEKDYIWSGKVRECQGISK